MSDESQKITAPPFYLHADEKLIESITNKLPTEEELFDVSHQLRVLKQSHLVKFRREGKTIFYSLADDHVITILNQGLEHVAE